MLLRYCTSLAPCHAALDIPFYLVCYPVVHPRCLIAFILLILWDQNDSRYYVLRCDNLRILLDFAVAVFSFEAMCDVCQR
jgi:hypothetical protein